jgi:ribosomal-protein-alanine N-acetyltransferase
MLTPKLQTARLTLRAVIQTDAPAIQRHFGRWEIIEHLSTAVPWPYPEDGADDFIRQVCLPGMANGSLMCWAIIPFGVDEAVGLIEYRVGDDLPDNRGFWISTEYQGKGYMTEAVEAFQDYVFFDLKVPRIFVCNAVNNVASRRIKEKTGAVLVDHIQLPHHSGVSDCERWEVTRESWAQHRGVDLG